MSKINVVDINSTEFEAKILEIFTKNKIKSSSRFLSLPDGWTRDLSTGLEWGESSNNDMNFSKAKEYCAKEGGRLPTMKELQGLVDYVTHSPSIDKNFFPDTKHSYYWTGDVTAWDSSAFWCVSFSNGLVYYDYESGYYSVRPVRSSQ